MSDGPPGARTLATERPSVTGADPGGSSSAGPRPVEPTVAIDQRSNAVVAVKATVGMPAIQPTVVTRPTVFCGFDGTGLGELVAWAVAFRSGGRFVLELGLGPGPPQAKTVAATRLVAATVNRLPGQWCLELGIFKNAAG